MLCSPSDLPPSRLPGMSSTVAIGGAWSYFPGAEAVYLADGGFLALFNGQWWFALDPAIHYAMSLRLKKRIPPMVQAQPFASCEEGPPQTPVIGGFTPPLPG